MNIEYQYHYLIKKGINLLDYFRSFNNFYYEQEEQYKKVLGKINIESKWFIKFVQNYPKSSKYKGRYGKIIDIFSVFLIPFSKTGLLGESTIKIDMKTIKKIIYHKKFKKKVKLIIIII